MKKIALAMLAWGWLVSSSCYAGFDEGLTAYKAGNYAQALKEWKPLAEQGNAKAQYHLAMMYDSGQGVPQDFNQATTLSRKAAERGNADAQVYLAMIYSAGRGVPQDNEQAASWMFKAAEGGNAWAQFVVGGGFEILKDYKEAVRWYRKSADQGNASAQFFLGMHYLLGQSVPQNRIVAYALHNLARTGGFQDSNRKSQENEETMSPRDIERAQALSRVMSQPGQLLKELDKYVRQNPGSAPARKAERSPAQGNADVYPARPNKRPGVVSCSTRCVNGDCYRTYDDGRNVHFRAKQKFNPFNNQFEWDSGSC